MKFAVLSFVGLVVTNISSNFACGQIANPSQIKKSPDQTAEQFTTDVFLSASPPACDDGGRRNRKLQDYTATNSLQFGPIIGDTAKGIYKILDTSSVCSKEWSLVRAENGKIGWIETQQLKAKTKTVFPEKENQSDQVIACGKKIKRDCLDQIKTMLGQEVIGEDESGLVNVRLASTSPPNNADRFASDEFAHLPSHRDFDSSCLMSSQGTPCSYAPFKTFDRMRQILANSCVEAVFAPNRFLVNRFYVDDPNDPDPKSDSYRDKVIYKNFQETDRFAIRIKDSCQISFPQPQTRQKSSNRSERK